MFDEIRAARELLSRSTGQPLYKYQGPHDTNLRLKQCVASIIGKIQDLYKDKQPVNYVNSATDLFRLASMLVKPGGMEKSTDYNSVDMRLHRIEMDLKYLKTSSLNQNPAAIPAPRFKSGGNTTNRQNLLKTLSSPSPSSMDSPSKRLRSGEPVIHSDTPKRTGQIRSQAWQPVEHRRNGKKPGSNHVPKGKPPRQPESFEVFLFRYAEDETTDSVLKYFKDMGVSSAHHVRLRCRPDADTKNFVIRIRDKDDFYKIVVSLPYYTGCRWYVPGPPPANSERPPGYFNSGGRIRGPDIEKILSTVRADPVQMDQASPAHVDNDEVAAGSNDLTVLDNSVSSSVQSTTLTAATTTTTTTTSAAVSTSSKPTITGVTPLNSPHMQTNNIVYETVVHKET